MDAASQRRRALLELTELSNFSVYRLRTADRCKRRAMELSPTVKINFLSTRRSIMARKYSKKASAKVGRAMRKRKSGTLKSGRSGKKVKSRKQAIAIGLSEARREGKKVPPKKSSKKSSSKRRSSKKKSGRKSKR
jgi:hypothetical protein